MVYNGISVAMTVHFSCTMCGKCCHDLRLPLSIDEALVWSERGGDVQLFCEGIPWPVEPPETDLLAAHKRGRSFPVMSGELPVRIAVTVVASFSGACPNLSEDMRCGAYEDRPRVCRIYPAEVNPFVELVPSGKACPPEAWGDDKLVLVEQGRLVDSETDRLIRLCRESDRNDANAKESLCFQLGASAAAIANEGFTVYSASRDTIISALKKARMENPDRADRLGWTLISNRQSTVDTLVSVGAQSVSTANTGAREFDYIGFFADAL
ncbi:YkgJ family cysteine cluster protein [Paraburkholderia sp.]|jgi:Fe-S-cluster containining protein|uniref:YkgJ family cysteine cluster protein n=1 Tax=Paraburkholderia sp. TaxID=1926495 RepID=UPI002F4200A9